MIIDCHVHIGRGERMADVFQIDCTVERAEYLMDKAGVEKSIIFPVGYEDYVAPNQEIAEIVRNNKKFIGFARVSNDMPNAAEHIQYAVKELGLVGLKVGDVPNREILDAVRELKIPVLAHSGMGLAPIKYEGVAQSYPDITLILAHLGIGITWDMMFASPLQAIYLAKTYKNVYLDTSAATWIQYVLEQAVREVGADKILFGSDGPWFYPAIMKACIKDLELSESDEAKIMGGNIASILNL